MVLLAILALCGLPLLRLGLALCRHRLLDEIKRQFGLQGAGDLQCKRPDGLELLVFGDASPRHPPRTYVDSPARCPACGECETGFTLIELLVMIANILTMTNNSINVNLVAAKR